jgi:deoxyribonuclease-4
MVGLRSRVMRPIRLEGMSLSAKRIGIHLATGGGASTAVERAHEIGANTFQIFSSSPRMWRAPKVPPEQCERMRALRARYDVGPLVIHTSYLVNVCSQNEEVRQKSIGAFRGEIERALALGAEYLVLHPGSWKGLTREEGLRLAAQSITQSIDGLAWQGTGFHILIENTAGAEFRWGAASSRWRSWWNGCGRSSSRRVPGHLPYARRRVRPCQPRGL